MHNQLEAAKILRDAAQTCKMDVDAISAAVKQEFATLFRTTDGGESWQEFSGLRGHGIGPAHPAYP